MNGCDCGDYCEWCSNPVAIYTPIAGLNDKCGLSGGVSVEILEIVSTGYVRVKAPSGNRFAVNGTLLIHPENLAR